jgi:hypothetical protein
VISMKETTVMVHTHGHLVLERFQVLTSLHPLDLTNVVSSSVIFKRFLTLILSGVL